METETITAEAPEFIARDTHAGKWQITRRCGQEDDYLTARFFARELAEESREGVMWEFSGHVRDGLELFHRTRYVAAENGDLHLYASDGHKVAVHPASRLLRVLRRDA